MKEKMKEILIGALVAYVVIDLLLSMISRRRFPSVVEKTASGIGEENILMAFCVGILAGFAAWYCLKGLGNKEKIY